MILFQLIADRFHRDCLHLIPFSTSDRRFFGYCTAQFSTHCVKFILIWTVTVSTVQERGISSFKPFSRTIEIAWSRNTGPPACHVVSLWFCTVSHNSSVGFNGPTIGSKTTVWSPSPMKHMSGHRSLSPGFIWCLSGPNVKSWGILWPTSGTAASRAPAWASIASPACQRRQWDKPNLRRFGILPAEVYTPYTPSFVRTRAAGICISLWSCEMSCWVAISSCQRRSTEVSVISLCMDMGEQPKHRCYAEIAVDWNFTGAAPSAPATQNRSKAALEQNVTEHSWVWESENRHKTAMGRPH